MNSIDEKTKKEVLNFAKKGDFGLSYSPVKFIYSEKATKFCEIFTLLLTGTT
jgi:hypothetical protein